jgi:ribose/xylose/arabinose/galactoside ABC-type transport system permease subunit
LLLAGNCVLLIAIRLLLRRDSSFTEILLRIGPDIAPVTLAAFALTGILFAGEIDLSIGSAIALAGTVFGWSVTRHFSPIAAFALCAATGWAVMAFNGTLVTRLRMPSIIITLAGLPFYRGIALIAADVAMPHFSGNLSVPQEIYHLPGKAYAGTILCIGTVLALFWENFGKYPRLWLALGNSLEACTLMGLRPERLSRAAFSLGGLFFGAAALVYVTRVQAVEPARMALGFELQVIAAVILGGTSIFGGEGSYAGTLLGSLFLYLVSQVLIYAGATAYVQEALTGAVILLIIGADCALHRKAKLKEELR